MHSRVLICACVCVHAYMHIFFEMISPHRPSWPGTYYINLVGLKFTKLYLSLPVLGLEL